MRATLGRCLRLTVLCEASENVSANSAFDRAVRGAGTIDDVPREKLGLMTGMQLRHVCRAKASEKNLHYAYMTPESKKPSRCRLG